jgi:hypothetical protein
VLRHESGLLARITLGELVDREGDAGVALPALGSELGAIGHLLDERVGEAKALLTAGGEWDEELAALQGAQRGGHALGRVHHPLDQRPGQATPDHGGHLQHRLLELGELIDPAAENRAQAGRDLEHIEWLSQPRSAGLTLERPAPEEAPHHLLAEEWVPRRTLLDPLGHGRHARVVAEQALQQLARVLGAEGAELDACIAERIQPVRRVFRTEVHQQEAPGVGHDPTDLCEERLARRVDPVEVLDHHENRRDARALQQQPPQQPDELALPRSGIEPRGGPLGVRRAQEVEEQRQAVLERPVDLSHAAGGPLANLPGRSERLDSQERPQQIQHRKERHATTVGRALRLEHLEPACPAVLGELPAESALPHASIADDRRRAPAPRLDLGEQRFEAAELLPPTHERREAAAPREIEARTQRTRPQQSEDADGLTGAFDLHLPEVLQLEEPLDESRGGFRDQDLAAGGEILHASGEPHREALRGVVHAKVVADLADHDLPGVESRAHRELDTARAELLRVDAQALGEVERRVTGATGVVLVGEGRPEERHDPVAGVLVDGAFEAVDALGEDREEAIEDRVPLFGLDPLRDLHGALDVHEQHRDVLALALQGASRSEDAIGEMAGGVGAGWAIAEDRSRRRRPTTARTEARAARQLGAAARTGLG